MSEAFVRDAPEASRYELVLDDHLIGLADYHDRDGVRVFPHFEVDPEHRGGGMAGRLAAFALDDCRAKGLKVEPVCPYLVTYVKRHPEVQDVLA